MHANLRCPLALVAGDRGDEPRADQTQGSRSTDWRAAQGREGPA